MQPAGAAHSEGLLVSHLHHVIHDVKVNGSWNGVLAHTLTLQDDKSIVYLTHSHESMYTLHCKVAHCTVCQLKAAQND